MGNSEEARDEERLANTHVIIGATGYSEIIVFRTPLPALLLFFYCTCIRLLSPSGTFSESLLSKQKGSVGSSLGRGDARGADSCILHRQERIIPVSLAEVGQMVQ